MRTKRIKRTFTKMGGVQRRGGMKKRRGAADIMAKEQVVLKFCDKEAFGNFCVKLKQEDIPFSLRGFQTLVMGKEEGEIPKKVNAVFEAYLKQEFVTVLKNSSTGRRKLPTRGEAERIIKELIKEF